MVSFNPSRSRMENKGTYSKLYDLVEKLKNSNDPKRKYEFILWLGKKLNVPNRNPKLINIWGTQKFLISIRLIKNIIEKKVQLDMFKRYLLSIDSWISGEEKLKIIKDNPAKISIKG